MTSSNHENVKCKSDSKFITAIVCPLIVIKFLAAIAILATSCVAIYYENHGGYDVSATIRDKYPNRYYGIVAGVAEIIFFAFFCFGVIGVIVGRKRTSNECQPNENDECRTCKQFVRPSIRSDHQDNYACCSVALIMIVFVVMPMIASTFFAQQFVEYVMWLAKIKSKVGAVKSIAISGLIASLIYALCNIAFLTILCTAITRIINDDIRKEKLQKAKTLRYQKLSINQQNAPPKVSWYRRSAALFDSLSSRTADSADSNSYDDDLKKKRPVEVTIGD